MALLRWISGFRRGNKGKDLLEFVKEHQEIEPRKADGEIEERRRECKFMNLKRSRASDNGNVKLRRNKAQEKRKQGKWKRGEDTSER